MICRSAVKPIFVGLGTAAVLAAGGASAIAAEAEAPTLSITLKATTPVEAEDPAPVIATVSTTSGVASDVQITDVDLTSSNDAVTPTVTEGCPVTDARCDLDTVNEDGETATSIVRVKGAFKDPVTVTVKMTVEGKLDGGLKKVESKPASVVFEPVEEEPPTDPPTQTPSDPPSSSKPPSTKPPSSKPPSTKPPSKPSPTDSSSGGDGGSGGGGGSGAGGSGGGNGSGGGSGSGSGSGGDGSSGSDGGYVPPNPNSSFDPKKPEVALPPIQPPNPSVAPSPGAATPHSRLQGNKAPVAQDLTFERMASTQIAWLAALLVAFSLLLTQLRLGRRRLPAGAAKRLKGTHRRPRRGMFGK
ncbi:hypothetical protein [Actinomadura sp. 3N407]|uniref:hypothetical protein n=1 Tax=Actinomadura sp. 3N407 TaxID=3457423 RepID=UPI003FCE8921